MTKEKGTSAHSNSVWNGSEWVSKTKAKPKDESDSPTLEEMANHAANHMSHQMEKEIEKMAASRAPAYVPDAPIEPKIVDKPVVKTAPRKNIKEKKS